MTRRILPPWALLALLPWAIYVTELTAVRSGQAANEQLVVHQRDTDEARTAESDLPDRTLSPGRSEGLGDSIWGFDCQNPPDDNQCLGVEFDGACFYVTGGGGTQHSHPNKLHFFDRDGNYLESVDQPTASDWGWRDMAYDGNHLYSSDDAYVYEWYVSGLPGHPVLHVVGSIPGPENPNRAMAYDPAAAHFWTANFVSDIYEFDKSGEVINQFPNAYSIYGMAWDTICPNGPWLWVSTQDPSTVRQFDPLTGTYTGVSFPVPGTAGGCAFSEEWDPDYGVLFYLSQASPDHVIAYQLCSQTHPSQTPRQVKLNGVVNLVRLLQVVTQPRVRHHIEHAKEDLEQTLSWFIDDSHIDTSHGHEVFDGEARVANQMALAAKHGKLTGLLAIIGECREVAMAMARADSFLAVVALGEAEANPGADRREIARAQQELSLALKHLEELDPEMTSHGIEWYQYDKAIDHFKKTWAHAIRAVSRGRGGQALSGETLPPEGPLLYQNHPNPCSHTTTIAYQLTPGQGDAGTRGDLSTYQRINLSIYDVAGRLVRTLVDQPSSHPPIQLSNRVIWDVRDHSGRAVAPGVYFCHLRACAEESQGAPGTARSGVQAPALTPAKVFNCTRTLVVLRQR